MITSDIRIFAKKRKIVCHFTDLAFADKLRPPSPLPHIFLQ